MRRWWEELGAFNWETVFRYRKRALTQAQRFPRCPLQPQPIMISAECAEELTPGIRAVCRQIGSSEPPVMESIQAESGYPLIQLVGCKLDQMTLTLSFNPESLGLIQSSYFNYYCTFFLKCLESSSVKLSTYQGFESGVLIRTRGANGNSVGIGRRFAYTWPQMACLK